MKIYYLHFQSLSFVSPTMLQVKVNFMDIINISILSIFTYLSKRFLLYIQKKCSPNSIKSTSAPKYTYLIEFFSILLLHMYQKGKPAYLQNEMKLLSLNCLTDDLPTKLMAYNFIINLGIKAPPPKKDCSNREN